MPRVSADASADGDTTAEAGPLVCSPNLALVGSCTAPDGTCVETWDGSGAPKTPACAGAWSTDLCSREHFVGICSEPATLECVTTRTIYYAGDAPTLETACNAVPGATFVLPNHP